MIKKTIVPLVKPSISYGTLVGQVVLNHRKRAGLDQAHLANALGITQSAYSRLEQGQSSMTLPQLRVVAEYLNYSPGALLDEVDTLAARLRSQGVEVQNEKTIPVAAVLIGLGILAAILAAGK